MFNMTLKEDLALFPTKVMVFASGLDTHAVAEAAVSIQSTNESVEASNVGGWQSYDNFIMEDPRLKEVFAVQEECINQYLTDYNICRYKLSNAWLNINGKGSFNWGHIHPGAQLSCCVYVQNPGNGIDLEDPRAVVSMLEGFALSPENYVEYNLRPEVGDIIVFPSWLRHKVPPNMTEEPRITIASNYHVEAL